MSFIKIYKKSIAKMFIALILIPIFSSCGQDNANLESESKILERNFKSEITDDMITELGNMHNYYLLEAFDNYNWDKNDKLNELFTSFNSVQDAIEYSITFTEPPKDIYENLLTIKDNLEYQSNYRFFDESMYFILEGEQKTVLEIEAFIDRQIKEAKINSIGSLDYKTFLAYGTVLKSSYKLWVDESLGGMGKFNEFKGYENNASLINRSNDWRVCARDVVAADAAAAGAGFLIAGIFGIIEGIACPWCMLARIALSSGFASGYAYYRSDNC